jgi:hypothetical protein
MRLFLRAGFAVALLAAACKDSPGPIDFTDPAAITANLGALDSAFDSDVYRSFSVAAGALDPAAPSAALQPAARLFGGTLPGLNRQSKSPYVMTLGRTQQLQDLAPQMSVAATAGRIIPDSMYGRVFQWDAALDVYTWQDSVIPGLTGVRFLLYQVVDGVVTEPVVEVGTLDLIDASTPSTLRLHVLVKGVGGNPVYVDYTTTVTATSTSVRATANGFLSNGLTAAANKTLDFDETFYVTQTGASVDASFTLNNPPVTFTLHESVTFGTESLVVSVTFRIVQPGETVSFSGRVAINYETNSVTVHAAVRLNGRTVATFDGDPDTAQWVDAGGEPLTADDLTALEGLNAAAAQFVLVVTELFSPIGIFFAAA